MSVVRLVAKALALGGTLWVLVATSRPVPPTCTTNVVEAVRFRVEGNCGPSGTVMIESTPTCTLAVDGGDAVLLPPFGGQTAVGPIGSVSLGVSGRVVGLDGGRPPLGDGGTVTCNPPFCDPTVWRQCTGAADDAGVIVLTCSTLDDEGSDSCVARLIP